MLTVLSEDAVASKGFEGCGVDCQARVRPEGEGSVASEVKVGGVVDIMVEVCPRLGVSTVKREGRLARCMAARASVQYTLQTVASLALMLVTIFKRTISSIRQTS